MLLLSSLWRVLCIGTQFVSYYVRLSKILILYEMRALELME